MEAHRIRCGARVGVFLDDSRLFIVSAVACHCRDVGAAGRLAAEEEARYLIEQAGFRPRDFRIVRPPDMPPGERRYILCSRQVDDETMSRLNAAIESE